MLLLNYIPLLIVAIILGAIVALVGKVIYENKGARISLALSFCAFCVFIFPLVLYKAIKKHRTAMIHKINKNNKLSEIQKKEARRVISKDSRLFFFVLKFTLVNYRVIIKIFTEMNSIKLENVKLSNLKRESAKREIENETETFLLKNLTKPLESYLSKSLA